MSISKGWNQPTPQADMCHASVRMYTTTMDGAKWFATLNKVQHANRAQPAGTAAPRPQVIVSPPHRRKRAMADPKRHHGCQG